MACQAFNQDENMNCVNECTSKKCYDEIYAPSPLEDGEIDHKRLKDFLSCVRLEIREQKLAKVRASRKRQPSTETP